MTVTDRTALEQERDYLVDALRRLDDEQASGALTAEEVDALRDAHTVRLATLLRTLTAAPPATTSKAVVNEKKKTVATKRVRRVNKTFARAGWAAVVIIFVGVAGFALLSGADDRTAGETTTGSVNQTPTELLSLAAQQTDQSKPADAVKTYDKVLALDPNNVQALAYRGWLVRLAGLSAEGETSIDKAIQLQPTYADARFFKGYILLRDKNDPAGAITQFQAFLDNNPPQEMVPLVQSAMNDAKALVNASSTTLPALP